MHDGMQGQGQGHECLKATQDESTVSSARDLFLTFAVKGVLSILDGILPK